MALEVTDTESRLWLQTKSATGHYWDQVLGVSQNVINKNFEALFKQNPEMANMYNSDNEAGYIDAVLEAPRLIIPGGIQAGTGEVYFQLKFKSGVMASSDDEELIPDMTGWCIASSVQITRQVEDAAAGASAADVAKVAREKQQLQQYFNVPGDYRIERLFAKLSNIKWQSFAKDFTTAGLDEKGNTIKFDDWALADARRFMRLTNWLTAWSYIQETKGRNILGYSFTLPPQSQITPTYQPTEQLHQTYAYKSSKQNAPYGGTGLTGIGTRNAFLYKEMVLNRTRPDDGTLVWSGNFCTMPSTVGGSDGIDGTFLLGRGVFLEMFLLPQLQTICQASDVYHPPTIYGNYAAGGGWWGMPFTIGADPRYPSSSDNVYKFINTNPTNEPNLPTTFKWTKVNSQGPQICLFADKGSLNLRTSTKSTMTITVTWELGTPNLMAVGTVRVETKSAWDRGTTPPNFDDLYSWDYYTHDIGYQINIILSTSGQNGALDTSVTYTNFTTSSKKESSSPGDPDINLVIDMKTRLAANFGSTVPVLERNLRAQLAGTGKFVYPGNGVFNFSNPLFTKYGDLVARVDYKALQPGQVVVVPSGPKLERPAQLAPVESRPTNHAVVGAWRATWTTENLVSGALVNAQITLKAQNTDKVTWIGFKEIRIKFTSKSTGSHLFFMDQWYLRAKEPPKVDPDSEGAPTTVSEYGVIDIRSDVKDKTNQPTFSLACTNIKTAKDKWTLTLDGVKDKLFLGPGEWVEVTWNGRLGPVGSYDIYIDEDWDEQEAAHWGANKTIVLEAKTY